MFERFTERARRVVVLAQEEARLLSHSYIGTEHLLLGLIHERDGVASRVLREAGVTLDAARAQVESVAGHGEHTRSPHAQSGHIPFTPRAKKILELSLREALEQKRSYIGTEHVLLGLLREGHGAGAQILERLAGPLPALRKKVIEASVAEPAEEADVGDQEAGGWPWAQAGRPPLAMFRSGDRYARVSPMVIGDFHALLQSIDRRLANVERHLGIAVEPETVEPETQADTPAEPEAE